MKPGFSVPLIVLFLWSATHAEAQGTLLEFRLKQGGTYTLDVEILQTTRSESTESEEISLSSHSRLIFHVDSIDRNEQIHMTVGYRDLQISMIAPGMDIAFNSGDRGNRILASMLDSLEVSSFQIILDRRGELKKLSGLAPIFASLSSGSGENSEEQQVVLRTLEEVYGPDSFRSLTGLFITIYPVLPGMTSWTNDITYFFNTKPVQMASRYNLTRITEEYRVIQGLGMLNSSTPFVDETGLGKVESTVTGSQTYDFQMDSKSGWLNRCVSRQRVIIQTTILNSPTLPAGLRIPSYTETVFEVNGSSAI